MTRRTLALVVLIASAELIVRIAPAHAGSNLRRLDDGSAADRRRTRRVASRPRRHVRCNRRRRFRCGQRSPRRQLLGSDDRRRSCSSSADERAFGVDYDFPHCGDYSRINAVTFLATMGNGTDNPPASGNDLTLVLFANGDPVDGLQIELGGGATTTTAPATTTTVPATTTTSIAQLPRTGSRSGGTLAAVAIMLVLSGAAIAASARRRNTC